MRVVLVVLAFALVLYALLDCARTPEEGMPARMPKFMWIALIVLFPTVGAIAWIIVSRVKAAEERGGYVEPTVWSSKEGTTLRRPGRRRPLAPDEDPEFLRNLEQDIRRRRHHPGASSPGATGPHPRAPRSGTGSGTREGGSTHGSREAGGRGAVGRESGTSGSPEADGSGEHRSSRNGSTTGAGDQDRQGDSDGTAEPGPADASRNGDTTHEP